MPSLLAADPLAIAVSQAIQDGDVVSLRQQLNDHPELARSGIVGDNGVSRTLLHIACDWPGHFPNGRETVRVLVAAGADVNAVVHLPKVDAAETPLHWAASSNDMAVLDALLDAGADIEAPGAVFTGGSPMSDAVVFAQWQAARRLLERGAATTLWQAAALGERAAVERYFSLEPAPSPDQLSNAFWHACRGGQLEVAEYLFQHGATLNWLGHQRKTPLDVARESGAIDLIHWLEAHGATSR